MKTSWRIAEVDLLNNEYGKLPFNKIVDRLNELCRENGWECRSEAAIRQKWGKIGHSRRVVRQSDWVNLYQLAKELNITHTRTNYFVAKLRLKAIQQINGVWQCRKSDFTEWARTHQKYLTGIDRQNLAKVILDDKLVDEISAQPVRSRPVLNVTTGKTYPNCAAAAKDCYISHSALNAALKAGKSTCCSFKWRYADSCI